VLRIAAQLDTWPRNEWPLKSCPDHWWLRLQLDPKSADPQKVLNKQEELGSQSEKQIFQGSFCVGPELASPRRSQRDTVRAATPLSDLQLAVA